MLALTALTTGSTTSLQTAETTRKPIAELKGAALLWDCVDIPGDVTNAKACIFCGHHFPGGPCRIGDHFEATGKHVKGCKPIIWLPRHKEVVAELKLRRQIAKQETDCKASKDAARLIALSPTIMNSLNMKPTNEQVDEEWAKALVKKGLAIDLVDDPCFRAAITMTARAGLQYVDAQNNTCKLPHRTCMSNKVLPALDKKLTEQVEAKIKGLLKLTGAMIISDGWTSIQARPIVNALLATPAGTMFLQALDTSGSTKDAKFIADFIINIIEARGPENIVAVCMDGACTGSFPLITAKYKHVFCFICPAHSLDNFFKNVFCDKMKIKIKGIEGDFDWGTDIFLEPFTEAWDVIKFVTNHSKPHSIFRDISNDQNTWLGRVQPFFCELIKFGDTRFASRLLLLKRYHSLRIVMESLVAHVGYKLWLDKQDKDVKEKGEEIRITVQKSAHWVAVECAVRVLSPTLKVLRLTDGKTGATLGKVHGLCVGLDALYRNDIVGMDDDTRERMHLLFTARWTYFHTDVFTAAKMLDSEYIKDEHTLSERKEFRNVLLKIAETPNSMGTPMYGIGQLLAEWAGFETALATGSHGLDSNQAFSDIACKMTSWEWASAFLYEWPGLRWVAMRLTSLSCSASGCEHSWSIEGWIHSTKRNRLGQTHVERLVRMHTNLLLGSRLEEWRAKALPWEIELLIDEPVTEE
jgi:hypothetical protein